MIVAADWLLPGEGEPLREGAVLVRGGRIADVGPFDRLVNCHREAPVTERPGCVLAPGLVNAHTHLSLTVFESLLEPAPFPEWLPRLVGATTHLDAEDLQASAEWGAFQCLRGGVTAVGDIGYGSGPSAAAARHGLGGVFFSEVLGIAADDLDRELARRRFPASSGSRAGGWILSGIAPHSVYTAGPGLLRAAHRFAREHRLPYALHVAESPAELQLLADGTGPLAGVASRQALGFQPPGTGAASYLDGLGVLADAVLVHCVHLSAQEIPKVAAQARGVVLCPRSNAFLGNGAPPVDELVRAGVELALGTDSSASNGDLDLFEEARALRALSPALSARTLVRMLTAGGARVLSAKGLGSLSQGCRGDLVTVRTAPTGTPEESFLEGTLDSVMSGGTWRVLSGRCLMPEPGRTAYESTLQKVRLALGRRS